MSEKPKAIYCGNGRIVSTKYGTFRSISICLSDIPKEFITKSEKNGKSYTKIIVSDKDAKDQYGNDVFVTVDQWKPDPNYKKTEKEQENNPATEDGLPF